MSYGSGSETRYGIPPAMLAPPLLAENWVKAGLPAYVRIWPAVAATAALEAGYSPE